MLIQDLVSLVRFDERLSFIQEDEPRYLGDDKGVRKLFKRMISEKRLEIDQQIEEIKISHSLRPKPKDVEMAS